MREHFDPSRFCDHPAMQTPSPRTEQPLLVACLCAQWCGTCCEYQLQFNALQIKFPHARFVWVDVEDEADLVDPVEVENFPTLLIAKAGTAHFFGTLTPHIETLQRLIESLLDDAARPLPGNEDAHGLARRLWSGAVDVRT